MLIFFLYRVSWYESVVILLIIPRGPFCSGIQSRHTHSALCLSFKIGYIESIKIVKKLPVIGRLTHDRK